MCTKHLGQCPWYSRTVLNAFNASKASTALDAIGFAKNSPNVKKKGGGTKAQGTTMSPRQSCSDTDHAPYNARATTNASSRPDVLNQKKTQALKPMEASTEQLYSSQTKETLETSTGSSNPKLAQAFGA